MSTIRDFSVNDIKCFVEKVLRPKLPHSVPLLRRCQFHRKHQYDGSQTGEVWIAGLVNLDTTFERENPWTAILLDRPWIAAHIDLANSGQTQVWSFASWEPQFCDVSNISDKVRRSSDFNTHQQLFDKLRARLRDHHIPRISDTPPSQWQRLKDTGKRVSEPFSKSKVLFGATANALWPHLQVMDGQSIARTDMSYHKYVMASTKESLMSSLIAPVGLHFQPMYERDLQTIIDRTDIPRSIETVRQLANIALYDDKERPISWCLLGKDASLSSLHTEPDYRRRGLAELTSRRIIAEQIELFEDSSGDDGEEPDIVWSHADVSEHNISSKKVMEKLGFKAMWRTAWIEVDLAV